MFLPRLLLCLVALTVTLNLHSERYAFAAETANTFNPAVENTFNPTVEEPDTADEAHEPLSFERLELNLTEGPIEDRVEAILSAMTLDEKIGQLTQVAQFGTGPNGELDPQLANALRAGKIGSLFYTGNADQTRQAQEFVQQESRLGLPLLAPRDVIHGFRTVFPIPLGMAATWNPELARQACDATAQESLAEGINWTFTPMLDIARDARWGRIAESMGEDPVLASEFAREMVRGFQGEIDPATGRRSGIAACAKHYIAYGLSEGGRDYNRAQVAISELHNVFLKPFHAAVEAGCETVMTSFNTINGIPGTGHKPLVRGTLKERWGFDGLVVSDWASITEMIPHGYAADRAEAAELAINAGVDMEMATLTYRQHLTELLETGRVEEATIDDAVRRVLRVKLRVALPRDRSSQDKESAYDRQAHHQLARQVARESLVLLKNNEGTLPLEASHLKRVALVGPLADAARDQLGCWMLDGRPEETQTIAAGLTAALAGKAEIDLLPTLASSIDTDTSNFAATLAAAEKADVVIACVGEGWILSGEARSRTELNLPGAQRELIRKLAELDKPLVLVVLAGRPLTMGAEAELADAVLYAWHPGTMGGPAVADVLLGEAEPAGRLPVTFPKVVGQVPLYYNHLNTGRPPAPDMKPLIGSGLPDYPDAIKYRSHYLDTDPFPLYPFGYGLSYTTFEYGDPELSVQQIEPGQTLGIRVKLTNTGSRPGTEVVQLYVQDVAARLVRPVRELKAFRRVTLDAGESTLVEFALTSDQLAYFNNEAQQVLEPGLFRLGVGGDATAPLTKEFFLRESAVAEHDRYHKEATRR